MKKLKFIFFVLLLSTTSILAKKGIFSGFGKISKSTGKYKTKIVGGYFRKSDGYKLVNPYARS